MPQGADGQPLNPADHPRNRLNMTVKSVCYGVHLDAALPNPPCWVFLKAHFDLQPGEHLSAHFMPLGNLSATNQYLEFAKATFIPKPMIDSSRSNTRDGYIPISDYIPNTGQVVELIVCSRDTTSSTLPKLSFLAAPCCAGLGKVKDAKLLKKCLLSLVPSLTYSAHGPDRLTW
jgi:hypothetical protein